METPKCNIPGFEFYMNNLTGHWALRPVKGYSEKNISDSTFVPQDYHKEPALFESADTDKSPKSKNFNLAKARKNKNDEFYTCLNDIASEMKHYEDFFKGKVVYCPCDKAFNNNRSQFVEYFISQFHQLGLKKLICTQYNPNGFGEVKIMGGIKWEYNGECSDSDFVDESEIDTYILKGNGSFQSEECRQFMKECDVIVTNPPFSLYEEFLSQIFEFDKKFIIIGSKDSISNKTIFPRMMDNKMWVGFKPMSGSMWFYCPNDYHDENSKQDYSGRWITPIKACWFTNIEHNKRHELLPLIKTYNPEEYPKYDYYDAIYIHYASDIPKDYMGVMAVPITFMDKYNPEQFEIIDARTITSVDRLKHKSTPLIKDGDGTIGGKAAFARICIRRK